MATFHSLKVVRHEPEAEDALRIGLAVPEELREQLRFQPGQHVAVRAVVAGEELRRTYSIVSAPGAAMLEIAPRILADGRLSQHFAQTVRPGQSLEVLAPTGGFHLAADPAARRTCVAFAAGCGITPVYAILAHILASEPHSRCILVYGNRTGARTMLLEDLMALKNRHMERLSLNFIMSAEPQDVALWNGRLDGAKVRELAGKVFDPAAADAILVCTPGVEDIKDSLVALGVEPRRIHTEHFHAARAAAQPVVQTAPVEKAQTATITVLMDGRRRQFAMPMGTDTILDAANAAGFDLPFSCRAGVCSTCRTRVTRGKVEMSEQYALEDWELEAGYVLACSSKPVTGEVELDYDDR
jgi:ring-1,2-phenylacetyl-CoA epoxidase subunit PaaE